MNKHLTSENGVNKLHTAFIFLLGQQDYNSITIKQITKAAGMNRTTYYLFYNNKLELARDICNTFLDDYIEIFMKSFGGYDINTKVLIKDAFYNLRKNKKMLLGLWSIQESSFSPYVQMQESIKNSIYDYLVNHHIKMLYEGSELFFAELYAANVMATVKWWITNEDYSFESIYQTIYVCTEKGVLQLLKK
ncbi:hypothetical protein [Lacrimispora sp. 38-1]|uniref:hypothetical protein n=1 Tax=Lacrimispora sp. 38-1 TaxID=3125778 RepID=UPI003CFA3EE2